MAKSKKKVYKKKSVKKIAKKGENRFAVWWRNLKRGKKAAIISCVSLLLVVSMLGSFVYFKYIGRINRTNIDEEIIEVEQISEDIINIGLFGIDTRDGLSFKGNTDSIMILSINSKTNKINIFSIMRDSLVPIEGYKTTKINAAYANGGPAMAINTINKNFGLDITDYVTVNFYGMEKIIDAIGGIEVPVTDDEMKPRTGAPKGMLNQCIQEQADKEGTKAVLVKSSGTQMLTGRQAVAWARIRKAKNFWGTNDDYGRTERQRYVMQKLFEKATNLPFSKYPGLIDAMLPCTQTSMSNGEILSLAKILTKGGVTLNTARIPSDAMLINGGFSANGASTVYFNLDDAKDLVHAVIYDGMTAEEFESTHTYSKTPWYHSSGSGSGSGNSSSSTSSTSPDDNSSDSTSSEEHTSSDTNSSQTSSDSSSSDSGSSDVGSSVPDNSSSTTSSSGNTPPGDTPVTPPEEDPPVDDGGDGGSTGDAEPVV